MTPAWLRLRKGARPPPSFSVPGASRGQGASRGGKPTMITMQHIPETLVPWEKNPGKQTFAMQSARKIGNFWGNIFRSRDGTLEL